MPAPAQPSTAHPSSPAAAGAPDTHYIQEKSTINHTRTLRRRTFHARKERLAAMARRAASTALMALGCLVLGAAAANTPPPGRSARALPRSAQERSRKTCQQLYTGLPAMSRAAARLVSLIRPSRPGNQSLLKGYSPRSSQSRVAGSSRSTALAQAAHSSEALRRGSSHPCCLPPRTSRTHRSSPHLCV